jgi:hypothetical protein
VMSKINGAFFSPLETCHMTYGSQRHNNMAAKFQLTWVTIYSLIYFKPIIDIINWPGLHQNNNNNNNNKHNDWLNSFVHLSLCIDNFNTQFFVTWWVSLFHSENAKNGFSEW